MNYLYAFILFLLLAVVGISIFSTRKKPGKSEEEEFLTAEEVTDAEMLKAAEEAATLEDAVRVYHHARHGSEAEQVAERKCHCEEFWCNSLLAVLHAETIPELNNAEKMAQLCGNKLALSFVPLAHEKISRIAVEHATGNPEKIILVAEDAPKGGEAHLIAFLDLQRLLSPAGANFHRPSK